MGEVAAEKTNTLAGGSGYKTRVFLKQILLATGPFLINVSKGMANGYSATMLPQLKQENSPMKINLDEETWIASALVPALALGSILGGYFSEKVGRKAAHTWTTIPLSITWLIIAYSPNVETIIVARFLAGLISGLSGPASSLYVGETSLPEYRGLLQTSMAAAVSIGILIVHAISTFAAWDMTAIISALFPMLCCIPFWFVPESPDWLVKKNKMEEARKAVRWIRESDDNINDIVDNLVLVNSNIQLNKTYRMNSLKKAIVKPEFYKPLLIINFYFIIAQWSGNNMICYYAIDIVKGSIGTNINEYLSVIIIDIIRILASFLACWISKSLPVRKITFVSGYGSGITILGLALSIFYSENLPAVVPFGFILIFVFLVTSGFVPIPWNLTGEMFPLKVRDLGSGVSQCIAYMAFFLLIKTGPYMFESLGQIVTYCIYASVSLVGTTVLFFILPETYGKTLQEIEDGFKKKGEKGEKTKDNLI